MLRLCPCFIPRLLFRQSRLLAQYTTQTLNHDTLRPYQRSCIEAIQEALGRHKRPAVSLPTGSGKTHVFSYLLQHIKPMYPEDSNIRTKVLVIVNRKELMEQSLYRIRETHPDLIVLPISGKHGYNEHGDVFVSTYQTLMRQPRLESIDPNTFKLIIIDEAHHSVAESYIRILSHFNAVIPPDPKELKNKITTPVAFEDLTALPSSKPNELVNKNTDPEDRRVHVVGFSATFWRNDSEFLREVYDEIAYHENVNSMIDSGYLCPAKITKIEVDSEELKSFANSKTGTLKAQDFFMHPSGMDLVFNTWSANSSQKSTVIFGCNLVHINNLLTLFRNYGVDARCVHGNISKEARADVLARFAAGEFPVLLNCQVLTEGTDIPRIDQVMIARGLGSTGMAMQMIGRGLRPHADKQFCNVILFANFAKFEGNLDFLPQLESLFNPDRDVQQRKEKDKEIDLEDTAIEKEEEAVVDADLDIDYGKLMLETNQFEPALLASGRYRPKHPLKSALMWLEWQKSYYLFPTSHLGYFTIKRQPSQGLWVASFVKQLNSRFKYSQSIIQSSDLVDVLLATEKHALLRWGHQGVKPLSVDSPWHYGAPTSKQIKLLEKKNIKPSSEITRGVMAGLINLISIGCKPTPELVRAVQNLIGRYKNEGGCVLEKKENTPVRNPHVSPPLIQDSRSYVGLIRSK